MPAIRPIAWEPPAKTGRYRGIMRRDLALWERWIDKHGGEVSAVAYRVALGGVEPIGEDIPEPDRLGFRESTALKIDVLLRTPEGIYVTEIRPDATTSAIGAALCYTRLLAREEPALVLAGGAIITENLPPDVAWLSEQFELRVWIV